MDFGKVLLGFTVAAWVFNLFHVTQIGEMFQSNINTDSTAVMILERFYLRFNRKDYKLDVTGFTFVSTGFDLA
ncbi:hypothetical protein [Candidatus Chlorohelix sp.]|uniref:hypothetical protein n=1 Tax=Candidatus Chlorohelix sp. TaxID=3139201 RepID=UPI0030521AAC